VNLVYVNSTQKVYQKNQPDKYFSQKTLCHTSFGLASIACCRFPLALPIKRTTTINTFVKISEKHSGINQSKLVLSNQLCYVVVFTAGSGIKRHEALSD
jgi:hypothetical protein